MLYYCVNIRWEQRASDEKSLSFHWISQLIPQRPPFSSSAIMSTYLSITTLVYTWLWVHFLCHTNTLLNTVRQCQKPLWLTNTCTSVTLFSAIWCVPIQLCSNRFSVWSRVTTFMLFPKPCCKTSTLSDLSCILSQRARVSSLQFKLQHFTLSVKFQVKQDVTSWSDVC